MKKLLSALLIATLLIASVACVFAVAEEGDTAPIATLNVNSGAIYATGSHTVLARIGENKTVEQITGYLLGGAGKDYNYFYVYAVVDGVVTAEYEELGRRANAEEPIKGEKNFVEVPEGGILVCISVVENETDMLKDTINVGTVVTLEGTTIEALSALEPKANIEGAKVIFTEPTEEDTTSSEDEATSSEETTSEDEATSSEDEATSSEETTSETPAASSSEAPAASSSDAPTTGDSGLIVFAILAVVALAGGIVVVRARG